MTDMPILLMLTALAFGVFLVRRLMTYLQYFQQEEYDNTRFIRWIIQVRAVDTRASLGILAFSAGAAFFPSHWWAGGVGLVFLAVAFFEKDPRKTGKKKLNFTQRARRIYLLALALALLPLALFLVYD